PAVVPLAFLMCRVFIEPGQRLCLSGMVQVPLDSALFPYTTLFRSQVPPSVKKSVPASAWSVPVLLTIQSTVVVPVPADFLTVPTSVSVTTVLLATLLPVVGLPIVTTA